MLNEDGTINEQLSSTLKSKLQKSGKEEARVDDKDGADFEQDGGRPHEALWQAIEKNESAVAIAFLD